MREQPIAWILWGSKAQEAFEAAGGDPATEGVLYSTHPSSFSAYRGTNAFLKSRCFSEANVFLLKQGIRVVFSAVRHPQTQGKVERFHRTLAERLRWVGVPTTLAALAANLILVVLAFAGSAMLGRKIGTTGLRAISKIISMLLAAIAVSMIRHGFAV